MSSYFGNISANNWSNSAPTAGQDQFYVQNAKYGGYSAAESHFAAAAAYRYPGYVPTHAAKPSAAIGAYDSPAAAAPHTASPPGSAVAAGYDSPAGFYGNIAAAAAAVASRADNPAAIDARDYSLSSAVSGSCKLGGGVAAVSAGGHIGGGCPVNTPHGYSASPGLVNGVSSDSSPYSTTGHQTASVAYSTSSSRNLSDSSANCNSSQNSSCKSNFYPWMKSYTGQYTIYY